MSLLQELTIPSEKVRHKLMSAEGDSWIFSDGNGPDPRAYKKAKKIKNTAKQIKAEQNQVKLLNCMKVGEICSSREIHDRVKLYTVLSTTVNQLMRLECRGLISKTITNGKSYYKRLK